MKIVSWNCRQGLYNNDKFKKIQELDADIYVILEINKPKDTSDEYKKFMKNSEILLYDNESDKGNNYGIAIIAKEGIKLEKNNWDLKSSNDFLSLRVNDSFDLVGVWTHIPYIKNTLNYLRIYEDELKNADNLIMCGDFNIDIGNDSNEKDKDMFIRILNDYGYESIYHKFKDEKLGEESVDTFHRHDGDFHIDYLFAKPERVTSFELGSKEKYVECGDDSSDHVPLIFEVDL